MYGSLLISKMDITISDVFMIMVVDAHLSSPYIFWSRLSRWYSLFFIVYVLLGVYFLTNLILAVIYDSFKEQVRFFTCVLILFVLAVFFTSELLLVLLPNSINSITLTWHSFGDTVRKANCSGGLYKEKYITEGI